ncbi:MAG: Wadjet anti-phage system protein JetD domain-containing protein [Hyphomicrobiaceae bacterium]
MVNWTAPADIRAEIERLWSRGLLLNCVLDRLTLGARQDALDPVTVCESRGPVLQAAPITFPYRLRLRRPLASELGSSFDAVRAWVRSLEVAARAETELGMDIEWDDVNRREVGRNRLPAALSLRSFEDALAVIGRQADADRFAGLAEVTLARHPKLVGWIKKKPLVLLDRYSEWLRILDVLDWFIAHPRSGLYVRQIDVRDVDTKFIEARKPLLGELLDLVFPAGAIEPSAIGTQQFEVRFGLAAKPTLVRFRLLDSRLAIAGLTDLSVSVSEFSKLDICASRVFIVENEVTGLAFPDVVDSMLVFGGGYGVERLTAARWLGSRSVIYWGDIDTHGFAILDKLRSMFPQAKSLLMDRETLLAHRVQWSFERAPQTADLHRLDSRECALYDDLRFNRQGAGVRLEQEYVSFSYACQAIFALQR